MLTKLVFYFFYTTLSSVPALLNDVDPSQSIMWGVGLKPDKIVLPARYFYVHLVNKNGQRLNDSSNENLEVFIGGPKENFCRVWVQTLNRKDGSFIIRFKVYNVCKNMKIDVRYNNMPIKGAPITFKNSVLPDDCECPIRIKKWLKNMRCKKNYDQITRDLKLFNNVNFTAMRQIIIDKFNKPTSVSLCHYVVKKNNIHRNCYGQYVGFKIFMDSILLSLTRKIILPDLEFFVNLGDWPLVREKDEIVPIFSWCGSDDSYDIVMPTYDITESTLECMGRVMLDMLSVQANDSPLWSNKIQKGFWRGRDSREERLKLVDIARENTDIFNYKYQINIDGSVAAYRFPYLLAGDSVVLKQDSHFYEHFYKELKQNVHFVPFKRDLSDLVEKIEWLRNNDEEARKISLAGQQYARENLTPRDILCYYVALFKEWSNIVKSDPVIQPGMEHVKQPESENKCFCPFDYDHDEL